MKLILASLVIRIDIKITFADFVLMVQDKGLGFVFKIGLVQAGLMWRLLAAFNGITQLGRLHRFWKSMELKFD